LSTFHNHTIVLVIHHTVQVNVGEAIGANNQIAQSYIDLIEA